MAHPNPDDEATSRTAPSGMPNSVSVRLLIEPDGAYRHTTPWVHHTGALHAVVEAVGESPLDRVTIQGQPAALRRLADHLTAAADTAEQALAAWRLAAPLVAPRGGAG